MADPGTNGTDVSSGTIEFVDRFLPPLEAGLYEVKVEQVLQHIVRTNPDGTKAPLSDSDPAYVDETAVDTSRFAVLGERFTIDPREIANRFPPPGCTGEYDNVLPHVVLNRKTLPWERSADGEEAPWFAVLVFDEADPPPTLQTVLVGDLQRAPFAKRPGAAVTPSRLADTTASMGGASFGLEFGQHLTDPCQVIDVPVELFTQIAPTVHELPLLTHGRTWSLADKAGTGLPATGSFSLVVANRLPAANSRTVAHLVSLETMSGMLPTVAGDGSVQPGKIPAASEPATAVRLVSLTSWEFTSVDPAQTFTGLLEGVTSLPAAAPAAPAGQQSPADATVAAALAMGYWPVNHTLRDGSATVSWYRGPFVPYPSTGGPQVQTPATGGVLATADDALRYDPTTGMFDTSYASAFELGRINALASGDFSTSLFTWKRANTHASALVAEAAILAQSLGDTLDATGGPLHAAAALLAVHVGPRLAARSGTECE